MQIKAPYTTRQWIPVETYRGYKIQRTYANVPDPFRVQALDRDRWVERRTLPQCKQFVDQMLS